VLGPMPTEAGCKSAWRASPDNLAAMEALFAGDIADTAAVARWITETVLPAHHVAPMAR